MLPYCVIAYNTTPDDPTGESTFSLLHGYGDSDNRVSNCMVDMNIYVTEMLTAVKLSHMQKRTMKTLGKS